MLRIIKYERKNTMMTTMMAASSTSEYKTPLGVFMKNLISNRRESAMIIVDDNAKSNNSHYTYPTSPVSSTAVAPTVSGISRRHRVLERWQGGEQNSWIHCPQRRESIEMDLHETAGEIGSSNDRMQIPQYCEMALQVAEGKYGFALQSPPTAYSSSI